MRRHLSDVPPVPPPVRPAVNDRLDADAVHAREHLILACEVLTHVFADDGRDLRDPARLEYLRESYRRIRSAAGF